MNKVAACNQFTGKSILSRFEQNFEDQQPGTQMKARLKWFNATKGFGFVSPTDGSGDAFLHVSVLQRAGLQTLGDQAELMVEVGAGPKGPQVSRIIEVLDAGQVGTGSQGGSSRFTDGNDRGGAGGSIGHGGQPARYNDATDGTEEQATGVVKWFKTDKGFGFLTIESSGQDVFVHKSVLQRSGISMLEAGQKVEMRFHEVEKGREATWVSLV